MQRFLPIPLACLGVALLAGTAGDRPARAQDVDEAAPQRCGELPPAVAETRERILDTASGGSLEALAALGNEGNFTASYGGGEPAELWTALAEEGTDIRAVARTLLALGCSVAPVQGETYYTWPAAVDLAYTDLTEEERTTLAALHGGDLESVYVEGTEVGYYVGWTLTITGDGDWVALVAGD